MLIFQGVVVLGCLIYRKILPRVDAHVDVREVYIDKLLFHINKYIYICTYIYFFIGERTHEYT